MKKKFLTEEQKQYILSHYANEQTQRIADVLGVSKKQVTSYANQRGIKKSDNFVVIRKDNALTLEQQDFILKNYSVLSNFEIIEKLNIDANLLYGFASRQRLKKDNVLLRRSSKIPLDKQQFILQNYSIMPTKDIAKLIGLDEKTIINFASTKHLKKDKSKFIPMCENNSGLTHEQKVFIIENYGEMKTKDMFGTLGLTKEQIRSYSSNRKLKKNFESLYKRDNYFEKCLENRRNKNYNKYSYLGKEKEPKIEADKLFKSSYGKYCINQDYFENIDNEWKAYWLGFLYADGCVIKENKDGKGRYSVSLGLKQEDRAHIQKFVNSLQSDNKIRDYKTNYKNCMASRVSIYNKKICEDLISWGCVPQKTFVLKFPNLPNNLIRHFIRGYFDGDGCISINLEKRFARFNLIGTYDILQNICSILEKECTASFPVFQTKNKNGEDTKIFSAQWGNIYTIHKIYQYLYKNCNIYLERKLEKFDILYCLE